MKSREQKYWPINEGMKWRPAASVTADLSGQSYKTSSLAVLPSPSRLIQAPLNVPAQQTSFVMVTMEFFARLSPQGFRTKHCVALANNIERDWTLQKQPLTKRATASWWACLFASWLAPELCINSLLSQTDLLSHESCVSCKCSFCTAASASLEFVSSYASLR